MMKSFQEALSRDTFLSGQNITRAQDQPVRLLLVLVAVITVAAVYVGLFGVYRPWNIDSTWFLSFSYNLCVNSVETDTVFGGEFPAGVGHLGTGMGGTVAFGKIAAYYQCMVLMPIGWSLTAAYLLSVATSLVTLGLIYLVARGAGYSAAQALFFCLALAILEPFFALFNQIKYEYISFLLAVTTLLLHQRGQLFLSTLVAILAFEVQPIGIMGLVYVGSAELSRWMHEGLSDAPRRLAVLAAGVAAGLSVFALLHPNMIGNFIALAALAQQTGSGRSHFLYPYFFEAKFLRHLPELAVFLVVLVIQIVRWRSLSWHFPIIASILTFVVGPIVGHSNYHYTPFWYFPSLLMVFQCFSWRFQPAAFFAAAAAFMLPQYAYVAYANHQYRGTDSYLREARAIVESHREPGTSAMIYGHYLFWFAFMDYPFYWDGQLGIVPIHTADQFFLVCIVKQLDNEAMYPDCAGDLARIGSTQRIGTVAYGGQTFEIHQADGRGLPPQDPALFGGGLLHGGGG